jgi:osmotically-inducible protein OsmY
LKSLFIIVVLLYSHISFAAPQELEEIDLPTKIQNEFHKDESLSKRARSVGAIQKHNIIILKGSVRDQQEKIKVGSIAEKASGGLTVINDTNVVSQEPVIQN